jgi:thiol-disulfide isomerase/thioredoxin
MQNRKLDALMFYRAARDLGGRESGRGKTDAEDLDQKIEPLYKDLGGTPATLALFKGKTKIEPLSAMQWAAAKNPLPAFSLPDLAGKTWQFSDLNGKPAFINIWATWCGPCREEHPALQKLYEEFKNGKEFTLPSINVDEKAGLVAPYMADGFGIPQNWFLIPGGKLATIQQG